MPRRFVSVAISRTRLTPEHHGHESSARGCLPPGARRRWRIRPPTVTFSVDVEQEADGRWLADVPTSPGVLCYGSGRSEVVARVQA